MPSPDPYTLRPYGTSGPTLHGQLLEFLQEGESWLKAQRPAAEWDRLLDLLGAQDGAFDLEGQSNTGFNNAKRITKEIVASLSNFRYEGQIKVTWNQDLYNQASALTKRDRAWFQQTHAHHRYRSILQYAVALGTGYAWQTWDKGYWGPGRGDVRLTPLAPDCVLCVQLPSDHDLQRAYMVIIREELPINLARRIYGQTNPAFAAALQPDRDAPGWIDKGLRKIQELLGQSPIARFFKGAGLDKHSPGSFPTVDLFHAYVLDDTINTGPDPIAMGAHGTNWSYTVPPYTPGKADQSALFPLRRLLIFARGVPFPAYDGSSPWWHGKVPLARFRFNDWAWEALGQSVIADTQAMQVGIEALMRDIEDSSHARMDPPLLYDANKVSRGFAEAVNPRRAGVRAEVNLDFGDAIKILGEQWQYEVPSWIITHLRDQIARQEKLTGSPDLVAIAKAKQVPGEGTLEKLMEMAGPLVQDMVRSVEEPLYELGEMRKSLYLQFDAYARMLQLVGPTGDEEEPYDYQPDLIVPLLTNGSVESPEARHNRARHYLHEFRYHLTESGINEIHRMTTKLAYLQLLKAGVPISWWTLAKLWSIPNFGPLPTNPETGVEAKNELETWVAQQHLMRELAGELAQETGQAGKGGPGGPGRPPTLQRPPQIARKDGGSRTTVKTSP